MGFTRMEWQYLLNLFTTTKIRPLDLGIGKGCSSLVGDDDKYLLRLACMTSCHIFRQYPFHTNLIKGLHKSMESAIYS